jgi:hypothetical protein
MTMRRDVLKLMGGGLAGAVWPNSAAAPPQFPKGAIIRTVLKDLPPEALTGGALLFHEHMSLAADFIPRWIAAGAIAARTLPRQSKSRVCSTSATDAATLLHAGR